MSGDHRSAKRPAPDRVLTEIADYVLEYEVTSTEALQTARHCLLDSIGCALLALQFPACQKLLGPVVPGAQMEEGARVPGTSYQLDPVQAAFNIGTLVRWLDYNDTWLAAEWGHPSDNLGGLLAVADYLCRHERKHISVQDLLVAMIKAHEVQGVLALENSFNRVGLDHVILVRIATTAVVTAMLGGNRAQVISAVSNAWLDGGALRTYRHAPNTGSRKSWAAGDATSRGVRHALMALAGEMGYPSALTAQTWGFYDVLFKGHTFFLTQPFGSYVMEHVLFKISFPAEFHAQTAVEAALQLYPEVKDRLDEIESVVIETQEAGARIIDKTGPLDNPADRDHCLQYMVAVPLIFGRLDAKDYDDEVAADPRIDSLRAKMIVRENPQFTRDYIAADKRAIPNAVHIHFRGGSKSERIEVLYPIGHRRRRIEGIPLLLDKFRKNAATVLPPARVAQLQTLIGDGRSLDKMSVASLMDLLVVA